MSRNHIRLAVTVAAVTSLALAGCGQRTTEGGSADGDFPGNKPIELIVSFAPGGAVDTAARLVAPQLEEAIGTNVEVVNRPGAGGEDSDLAPAKVRRRTTTRRTTTATGTSGRSSSGRARTGTRTTSTRAPRARKSTKKA